MKWLLLWLPGGGNVNNEVLVVVTVHKDLETCFTGIGDLLYYNHQRHL